MLDPFKYGIIAMTGIFVVVGVIIAGGVGLFALFLLLGLLRGGRQDRNQYHGGHHNGQYHNPPTRTVYRMDPP